MARIPKDEQRCNLLLWPRDGLMTCHRGLGSPKLEVSIGLTDSKLGLGFAIGDTTFVLDRAQVENLAGFLTLQASRMSKSGRRNGFIDFARGHGNTKVTAK